jgi:hypothetical protein
MLQLADRIADLAEWNESTHYHLDVIDVGASSENWSITYSTQSGYRTVASGKTPADLDNRLGLWK